MGKSESQMDIMEKSTKPGKRRWTVAEIGLSVLLLLVSCALAGLIVLYTSALREIPGVSRSSVTEGQQYLSGPSNVCTTPECVTAAARLLQNMDATVEACQNFYQYACGGWLERHTESDQDRDAFKKAKTLYSSCMNETLIEQRDSQPLMRLIDSIGDWPVASEDWNSVTEEAWSLEDTLATLNSRYHKKVMLDMYVWTDDRDSKRHIIYIDQPGLGMPSRDYYFNDGNYKRVREAYLQFMVSMARIARENRNLTQEDDRVVEEMVQVLELETDIANATSPAEERQDVTILYNKMTLSKLQESFNLNGFNWMRFVRGVLSSVAVELQLEEEVVVYSSPYLEKMNDVLSKHTVRTMQNYLTWQLVMERALYGTTVEEARWRDCVRYVQGSMENAVGALYVRETFAGESKRMVSDLISKIQEAYVETLEELSWMDDQSKEKAREKAMAIKEHIGYPDHILEESNLKLDQEYAHLNFSEENYFENILENLQAEAHKTLKKLREPVDHWRCCCQCFLLAKQKPD
ncbi:unnamed protein product, partial [Coregonus sp. 'balchen']